MTVNSYPVLNVIVYFPKESSTEWYNLLSVALCHKAIFRRQINKMTSRIPY